VGGKLPTPQNYAPLATHPIPNHVARTTTVTLRGETLRYRVAI
jgi:hypothetical protein